MRTIYVYHAYANTPDNEYAQTTTLPVVSTPSMSRRSKEYRVTDGRGRGCEVIKRLYSSAEVLIPGLFSSNGRQQVKGGQIPMQHLQHCTHSREKDSIWNGRTATFKGNPKLARLHVRKYHCCVMSWKAADDRQSLEQVPISDCGTCTCTEGEHECRDNCCCAIQDAEGDYADLAQKTCKTKGACSGENCLVVGMVLPSSYVWFSIAQAKGDLSHSFAGMNIHGGTLPTLQRKTEADFLKSWNGKTPYGVHAFLANIKDMLDMYRQQIAPKGCQIVLRCGGTLLYTKEVCYVVIVTYVGDGIHDSFPPVTSPNSDDNREFPRFNWSPLLDDSGCYTGTKDGYPTFTPHHMKLYPFDNWDHVAFAIHLPEGKELSLHKDILVGGGPLETVHYTPDTWCHRFRKFGTDAAAKCKEAEQRYKAGTHYCKAFPKTHATQ